ncbi:MAG TPA: Hpt domain-containing protein [Candidatus Saccharimonadales bacterium]|nr:Hpt domain-containing protein [Candidatus Saccharimonadales bacterium]
MTLSKDEQQKYKELYLRTARQYVTEMKDNVSQLLTGNETADVIEALLLSAHSLKGQSQMMGYDSMSSVSSVLEKIFRAKKDTTFTLSHDLISKLPDAVQTMSEDLDEIDNNDKENDVTDVADMLQTLSGIE